MPTYKIVRFHHTSGVQKVMKRGLTLEEAQAHCSDPETSASTCTYKEGKDYTKEVGPWFDGYHIEE